MSRQYNMYNVQLSEFWKQRCGKETMHNAPYMFEADEVSEYAESEAPSRISSRAATSVASTATRQKIEELTAKLAEERKSRIAAEDKLKKLLKDGASS